MRALLAKDYYTAAQNHGSYMWAVLLAGVAGGVWQRFYAFPVMMFALVVMVMASSVFLYDEKTSWLAYAAALPLPRKAIAAEKYLFLGLNTLACLVFTGLCAALQVAMGDGRNVLETVVLGFLFTYTFATAILICLPLIFRVEIEKVRTITLVAYFVPFAALVGALLINGDALFRFLSSLWFLAGYPLLLLAGGFISLKFSQRIVLQKEF